VHCGAGNRTSRPRERERDGTTPRLTLRSGCPAQVSFRSSEKEKTIRGRKRFVKTNPVVVVVVVVDVIRAAEEVTILRINSVTTQPYKELRLCVVVVAEYVSRCHVAVLFLRALLNKCHITVRIALLLNYYSVLC